MDKLWAPWRRQYIRRRKPRGCIFCEKPKEKKDSKNYILSRTNFSFSMLNIFPYNNGHIMIAPFRHTIDFANLSREETIDLIELLNRTKRLLERTLRPHSFNIGINMGHLAGAGYSHLHIHMVPRWAGDTNFMPVLADTKVIPESLAELYKRLKKSAYTAKSQKVRQIAKVPLKR